MQGCEGQIIGDVRREGAQQYRWMLGRTPVCIHGSSRPGGSDAHNKKHSHGVRQGNHSKKHKKQANIKKGMIGDVAHLCA
jgi:hypothetical protein